MLIPHKQLSAEALQGLIEDFVTRDGTDYGETETPLATKAALVRTQLDNGLSVIVFDDSGEDGSVSIVSKDRLPLAPRF